MSLRRQKGVMQLHVLFRMAYKNLFFKKLRTGLTILGVVIGIGSVVFLFSFGLGLEHLVSQQVVDSSSVKTIDVTSPRSKVLHLNDDNVAQIKSLNFVDSVGKVYSLAGKSKVGSSETYSVIYAVDRAYLGLSNIKLVSGVTLDPDKADQAIVNTSLLKAMGIADNQKALNQTAALNFEATDPATGAKKPISKSLQIKGVIESGSGAEVFMSSKNAEAEGITDASTIKVVVASQSNVSKVRKEVESLGFSTASPIDTLDQITQVFTLLKFVLVGFGGIGIIIAILGMFNTLTIALLERTREIALMITLGAQQADVRRLFIIEALMLSSLGGITGIVTAFLLGALGDLILNGFARSRGVTEHISAFSITPWLVLVTLLLSAGLGLIVVYFPARRASSIDPIDAQRFE